MFHRPVSVLAATALAGAVLLAPGSAFAAPHRAAPSWGTPHDSDHAARSTKQRATDGLLTWTVKDHKVTLSSATHGVVPMVYTCGGSEDPVEEQVDPGVFQVVFGDAQAVAFDEANLPSFTCDGDQHTLSWGFTAMDSSTFENGSAEVGLSRPEIQNDPTFEHVALVGLKDSRAGVAVSVNASPEPVKKGKTITVTGTVKRNGKAYKGKQATLYFAADNLSANAVGTAKATSSGKLKTTVKATASGTYYWVTSSTSKTQAGTTPGDHVKVTG